MPILCHPWKWPEGLRKTFLLCWILCPFVLIPSNGLWGKRVRDVSHMKGGKSIRFFSKGGKTFLRLRQTLLKDVGSSSKICGNLEQVLGFLKTTKSSDNVELLKVAWTKCCVNKIWENSQHWQRKKGFFPTCDSRINSCLPIQIFL